MKTPREHPKPDEIGAMTSDELWRYVIDELDFLVTPEQRRCPTSVEAAIRELRLRWR